jgi:hypothetical protein
VKFKDARSTAADAATKHGTYRGGVVYRRQLRRSRSILLLFSYWREDIVPMAEPVQLVLKERAQDRDTERNRQQTRLLTLPFSLAFTALPRPACTLHAMYTLSLATPLFPLLRVSAVSVIVAAL